MTEPTPDANWPSVWTLSATEISSFSAYREAGFQSSVDFPQFAGCDSDHTRVGIAPAVTSPEAVVEHPGQDRLGCRTGARQL